MATIAGTILVVAYVGLLGSFIIQMRWLEGPYHGIVPLVLLIATAKGADTGAYTVGRIGQAQALAQPQPEQDHRRAHRRHALRRCWPRSWSLQRLAICSHLHCAGWPQHRLRSCSSALPPNSAT